MTRTLRQVGIDIQDAEENRGLVDAIKADNRELTIRHLPGLLKLQSAGRIVINRETVEQQIGREWDTGEFQLAIVSYAGNFSEWDDDQIIVSWEH
jgi:phenol/toluene 2-monooxygenase (NADH) P2/A2